MRLPTFYEQNLIPNWGKYSSFLLLVFTMRQLFVKRGGKTEIVNRMADFGFIPSLFIHPDVVL